MALVIKGSSSGQITVDVPASAGTNTLTLPASTQVLANTPAFSVKLSGNQSISETTNTKITFDSEEFDTDGAFASNKFTVPSGKAGIYFFNSSARIDSEVNGNLLISQLNFYKNGSVFKRNYNYYSDSYIRAFSHTTSALMDLSVGDYIEMYAYINTVDNSGGNISGLTYSYFSGHKLIT